MNEPIPVSIGELRDKMRTIINGAIAGNTYLLTDGQQRIPVALITPIPKIPGQQNGCDQ